MEPKQELYLTSDMGLAAYLRLQGHRLVSVRYANRKCTWSFAKAGTMSADTAKYRNGDALVDPLKYNESFRECTLELRKAAEAV